jgi:hypothetical protein
MKREVLRRHHSVHRTKTKGMEMIPLVSSPMALRQLKIFLQISRESRKEIREEGI